MFAIFETGGKQHRAEKGAKICVEKLDQKPGEKIEFDRVFLVADGEKVAVGTPFVAGAKVSAKILKTDRAEKIRVVKFRAKKRSKSINGHRQFFTEIEITGISQK